MGPCPADLRKSLDTHRSLDDCPYWRVDVQIDVPCPESHHKRIARFAVANLGRRPIAPPAVHRIDTKHVTPQQLNRTSRPYVTMERACRNAVLSQHPFGIGWLQPHPPLRVFAFESVHALLELRH